MRGDLAQGVIDRMQNAARVRLCHWRREREQAVAGRQDAAAEQALVECIEPPVLGLARIDGSIVRNRMRGKMNLEQRTEAHALAGKAMPVERGGHPFAQECAQRIARAISTIARR